MTYAVGVDIGGTFTDFVFTRSDGAVHVKKVLSTPDAPDDALMTGLEEHAAEQGLTLEQFLGEVEVFVHGTTIATNTVIQRNGPRVGLICTQGHRDVLAIRDGYKWDRFNIHMDPPDPFVPRRLRIGVSERIDHRGEVVIPLEMRDVDRALTLFQAEGVQSIAIAFLWSVINPSHEQRVRQYIEEQMPEAEVVLSCDVLPILREWPRHVFHGFVGVHQAKSEILFAPSCYPSRGERVQTGPTHNASVGRHIFDRRNRATSDLRAWVRSGGGASRRAGSRRRVRVGQCDYRRYGRHKFRCMCCHRQIGACEL